MYPFISLFSIDMYTFPFIIMIAFFSCLFVITISKKYAFSSVQIIHKGFPYVLLSAIIGGKTLYLISRIAFTSSFFELINGFVFYGGFIGTLLGLFLYSKKSNYKFLELTDLYISVLPLAQAIGRIGCYCNGCCYGKEYSGILSVKYYVDGKYVQVFPTWFVESFFCLIVFIAFFSISKSKPTGFYTYIYMVVYSIFRFFIEFMRGDSIRGVYNGISMSQIISVFLFFCGLVLRYYSKSKLERNSLIIDKLKL